MVMIDDAFVGQLMTSDVHTVGISATVREVAQSLREHHINSLIVVEDDGTLIGIITATDVVDCVASGDDPDEDTVARCMTRDVKSVRASDTVPEVADLFDENNFNHAPVVDDDNKVVGVISTTDFSDYISRSVEASDFATK